MFQKDKHCCMLKKNLKTVTNLVISHITYWWLLTLHPLHPACTSLQRHSLILSYFHWLSFIFSLEHTSTSTSVGSPPPPTLLTVFYQAGNCLFLLFFCLDSVLELVLATALCCSRTDSLSMLYHHIIYFNSDNNPNQKERLRLCDRIRTTSSMWVHIFSSFWNIWTYLVYWELKLLSFRGVKALFMTRSSLLLLKQSLK